MKNSITLKHIDLFREPARRLVWWMTPQEALDNPLRLILQIMNLGTLPDLRLLQNELGENEL